MYLTIVFLPLLGSVLAGLFGRFLGLYGSAIITSTLIGVCTAFAYIAFYQIGFLGNACYIELFPWIDSGMLHTSWGFLFDSLTVTMLVTVLTVSFCVHIYSFGYMGEDPHLPRFMSYLSLFTFFMLMLVTGENLIQLFVGWEGVGLCSYLLIGFWHTRIEANKSAMKAMIVNRIGDLGMVLAISAIFLVFKTINLTSIFATSYHWVGRTFIFLNMELDIITVITSLLFVGAIGKSAQIGLHTWLPDAMEGPTPVSALIHAATMVTAGVFLTIRFSPLFEDSSFSLFLVTIVGALTAFFAGTAGLVQNDLKKVIAYSTCSQLGYMIFASGVSAYSASIFHLMNHAFFKALLFLGAGCVIHAIGDEQDMRKMGGLLRMLPYTYGMMMVGSLSLMGFPFLTGYYSKDLILEMAASKYSISGGFAYWLGVVSAGCTAFYSMRLIFLTFIRRSNGPRSAIEVEHAHDAPSSMGLPLLVLAFGSIFVGYLLKDCMVGVGTDFWGTALEIHPENQTLLAAEFLPYSVKIMPIIFSISGGALAIFLYQFGYTFLYKMKFAFRPVYELMVHKWYFDNVYNYFIVRNLMSFGYSISFKTIDRGWIEVMGPTGLSLIVSRAIKQLSRFQTGLVYNYAFIMLVGLVIYLEFHFFII